MARNSAPCGPEIAPRRTADPYRICAQFEQWRHGGLDRHVGRCVFELRLSVIRSVLTDDKGKAIVLPAFDLIDFVRRKFVAEIVLPGVTGPHAARLRIPIEADRVVQSTSVRLERAACVKHLNRPPAGIGSTQTLLRGSDGDMLRRPSGPKLMVRVTWSDGVELGRSTTFSGAPDGLPLVHFTRITAGVVAM
jgi:hypothetical protein